MCVYVCVCVGTQKYYLPVERAQEGLTVCMHGCRTAKVLPLHIHICIYIHTKHKYYLPIERAQEGLTVCMHGCRTAKVRQYALSTYTHVYIHT